MKAKKMLAVFVSMAIAATAIAGLAGCGKKNNGGSGGGEGGSGSTEVCDGTNHTFDTNTWANNDSGHWHPATCEHDWALGDFAAHKFKDGSCEVCGWPDPNADSGSGDDETHKFATGWTSDTNYHWHICENHPNDTTDVSGKAAHFDEDNNGECDECHAAVSKTDDPIESTLVVLAYTTDAWASTTEKGFYEITETYDGQHFSLEIELTEGTEFYLYEDLSKTEPDDNGNTRTWYNYGQLASGNQLFDQSAASEGYGTVNFVVRATKSYTFDFYIGTSYGGEPESPHFDAYVTGTQPGGGGGDVGGGEADWTQQITLHYHNINNWSTVSVYSWENGYGTEFLGGYPGKGDTVVSESNSWVKITYNVHPGSIGNLCVIFNNGIVGTENGEQKTIDILLTTENLGSNYEAWISGSNNGVYSSQSAAETADSQGLVAALIGGNWDGASGWSEKAMQEDTSYTGGQKFTITVDLVTGQELYFHLTNSNWPKTISNGSNYFGGGGNNNLTVNEGGNYTFTLIYRGGTNWTIDAVKNS